MSPTDAVARVNINFPVRFSACATILLFALTAAFYNASGSIKETILFFAVGAAAVGQITASFFAARLLAQTIQSSERDDERERRAEERERRVATREEAHDAFILRREALKFGARWNDPSMASARHTLRGIAQCSEKPHAELIAFITENEGAVSHVMNFLEEMATNCRHEVVDVEIMRRQFDFVVVQTWETLLPWIISMRRRQNAAIWEDAQWLYDSWKTS